FFFYNVTAPTALYTLSLHDALPIFLPEILLLMICAVASAADNQPSAAANVDWEKVRATPAKLTVINMTLVPLKAGAEKDGWLTVDRKSTRLNSSHLGISYAVFCLKK